MLRVMLCPGPGGGRDLPELGLAGGHLSPAARRGLGSQRGHLRRHGENTNTVLCVYRVGFGIWIFG